MKALVCALVAAYGSVATAEPPLVFQRDVSRAPEPMLGFGFGGGSLPGRDLDVFGLELEAERALGLRRTGWRLAARYEYLFVGHRGQDRMPTATLDEGQAHRLTIALRHSLVRTRVLAEHLRLFVDGDVGAGAMLGLHGETTMLDVSVFAGLRAGYDIIRLRRRTRASPLWEPAIWARVLSTGRDLPLGWMVGLGLSWGG